jgi:hypothetical protein
VWPIVDIMEIFLTWSGNVSHSVAEAIRDWLPLVLQRTKPFLSSADIRKGARWRNDIAARLHSARFAIVCLTADNLEAPWIHFEAGAVSKEIDAGKVTALLINVSASEVSGPLAQFQHTTIAKGDIRKLIGELNQELGQDALLDAALNQTFDAFWPQLENALATAIDASKRVAAPAKRSPEEILGEVLDISRTTNRTLTALYEVQNNLAEAYGLLSSRLGTAQQSPLGSLSNLLSALPRANTLLSDEQMASLQLPNQKSSGSSMRDLIRQRRLRHPARSAEPMLDENAEGKAAPALNPKTPTDKSE